MDETRKPESTNEEAPIKPAPPAPQPEPAKEPEVQVQPQEPIAEPTPPPAPEPEPIPEPAPQTEETPPPPPPTPEQTPTPPIVEEPVAPPPPPTSDSIPEPPKPVKDEPEAKEPKVDPTPPVVSTPPPAVETPPPTLPLAPAVHDPKHIKDVPQRVLELTEEEINAARKLWAREHIGAAQLQANKNRTTRMNKRMDEIEKLVKAKPNISVHTIANSVQLSQKLTSGYLQKLVRAGRIQATGNTNSRLFY